jgi:hypothetical protein
MTKGHWLTFAAATCAVLGLTAVDAEAAKKRAKDTLIIGGCARFAPPFCTVVSSRGTTYVLHGAAPPIPPNTNVSVVGKKTGDIGICFGTQVQVISWKSRGACK